MAGLNNIGLLQLVLVLGIRTLLTGVCIVMIVYFSKKVREEVNEQ